MTSQIDKQLFQVQNILETLQEATEHFADLTKKKELNQSIFIFSSIVDGCSAIMQILANIDETNFNTQLKALEGHLFLIAQQLEQGNFIKIAEIVQFSFAPELKKLHQIFIETEGNQKQDKTISIGVFNGTRNPKVFYTPERLNATIYESEKQNTNLYFFSSKDINFEEKQVNAEVFQNGSWTSINVPFPDVIHNVGVGKQSHEERKLRRILPFTSFYVGNKFTMPKRMLENKDYAELLVPFIPCAREDAINTFIEKNQRVVFKALGSNRGENIYFLNKKGNRYVLLDQKKESILSQDALSDFIKNIILAQKGSYIVQRYIHTRTRNDEPYHFRAHVQKNGVGQWQLTHIYPRIGNKKSNLSNISTEGRIENFAQFLIDEYGEKQGSQYEEEILDLSIKVTLHLDKLYGLRLDELGIDFAIDDTGRIWMHEANNGPQTSFHEELRAINTIAYAKYIAQNGILHRESVERIGLPKDQFEARTAKLPFTEVKNQPVIGSLVTNLESNALLEKIAEQAKLQNMAFYYFTPKDIDFNDMLIRGTHIDEHQSEPRIFDYPDIVIDFIKSNDSDTRKILYEELGHIPFTNNWSKKKTTRSEIYNLINENDTTIKFLKINRLRDVFQLLEKYGKVVLKPENISANTTYAIEKVDKRYQVTSENKIKDYHEVQLRNFIVELLDKTAFIVQADNREKTSNGQLPEILIHLMRNENNEWAFIGLHAKVQQIDDEKQVEVQTKLLTEFVEYEYGEEFIELLSNQVKQFSLETISLLEKQSGIPLNEAALTIAINVQQELSILEISPNGPSSIQDEQTFVKAVISYANSLI